MTTADKVIQALHTYGLQDKGNGGYRSRSPFRSDSDSPSFSLKVDTDGEHGTYYDFVSEDSGSLYDLAAHLGIDTPTGGTTQVESTKRDYESISDYEIAHGLPRGTLKSMGWEQIVYQGRIALSFPTANGNRYRFLTGDGNRYTSPTGYKSCWYGLDNKLIKRVAETKTLVIANGEIGTITARYYGLAACAVTGGERDIPDDLIKHFQAFLAGMDFEILIPADCDDKGREVALKRQSTFTKAGYSVKVLDLGLSENGDIGDFCMLHGDGAINLTDKLKGLPTLSVADAPFDMSIALEDIRSKRTWTIMPARDLKKLPPIKWLEKPIITNRGTTVIYGASGSGKSFYTLDKALHIAQKHKVLYIAAEGEYGYRDRVEAWTQHYRMDEGQLFMCTGAVNFSDDTQLSEFVYELKSVVGDVSLIIIDTLARSMGGADENSTRDMNKFVDTCDVIKAYFECAMVIVHHTNKGGVSERGSGALRGAADVMINLTDEDDLTLVECSKTKDNEPFDSYYFRLQPVNIGRVDEDGEPVTPAVAVLSERVPQDDKSPLTNKQRKVLNTLAMDVFAYGATSGELSGAIPEIPDRTMYRVLDRLTALNYIKQSGKRQPYTITDEGLIKIGELPRNDGSATSATSNDTSIFSNFDSTLSHSGGSGISGSNGSIATNSNGNPTQSALISVPVAPKTHYEEGY